VSSSRAEYARFVGGPMDGQGVFTDETDAEISRLPEHVAVDGGDLPVGYRLVRGPGEWRYVVDPAVADACLVEVWGRAGASAYLRVLNETGDANQAWEAAKAAKEAQR
jgi:hypothetical protein